MQRNDIWLEIDIAMRQDKKQNANWPDHAAAQAGKVVCASGKLMKECMLKKYHAATNESEIAMQDEMIKRAAVDSAVQAIRFLENLK
jgi:hypothetical protein